MIKKPSTPNTITHRRSARNGRAPAAFNRIGNVRIEAVDRDIHRVRSSNPMPKERAANPWWYEVIVSRRREQDFRGVRKEPGALHKDPLVQGKDQRRAESKETERSIEHDERKRHVEHRNPEQHDIDRTEKQSRVVGAEQQHEISQIKWQAEGGNKIE